MASTAGNFTPAKLNEPSRSADAAEAEELLLLQGEGETGQEAISMS